MDWLTKETFTRYFFVLAGLSKGERILGVFLVDLYWHYSSAPIYPENFEDQTLDRGSFARIALSI